MGWLRSLIEACWRGPSRAWQWLPFRREGRRLRTRVGRREWTIPVGTIVLIAATLVVAGTGGLLVAWQYGVARIAVKLGQAGGVTEVLLVLGAAALVLHLLGLIYVVWRLRRIGAYADEVREIAEVLATSHYDSPPDSSGSPTRRILLDNLERFRDHHLEKSGLRAAVTNVKDIARHTSGLDTGLDSLEQTLRSDGASRDERLSELASLLRQLLAATGSSLAPAPAAKLEGPRPPSQSVSRAPQTTAKPPAPVEPAARPARPSAQERVAGLASLADESLAKYEGMTFPVEREKEVIVGFLRFAGQVASVCAELYSLLESPSLDAASVREKRLEWPRYVLWPLFPRAESVAPSVFQDSHRKVLDRYGQLLDLRVRVERMRRDAFDALRQKLGLEQFGVDGERIEPGQKGHHVVETVPHHDNNQEGVICEVQTPGYRFSLDEQGYFLVDAQVKVYQYQLPIATGGTAAVGVGPDQGRAADVSDGAGAGVARGEPASPDGASAPSDPQALLERLKCATRDAQEELRARAGGPRAPLNPLFEFAGKAAEACESLMAFLAHRPHCADMAKANSRKWGERLFGPLFTDASGSGGVPETREHWEQQGRPFPCLIEALEALRESAKQRIEEALRPARFGAAGDPVSREDTAYHVRGGPAQRVGGTYVVSEVHSLGYRFALGDEYYVLAEAVVSVEEATEQTLAGYTQRSHGVGTSPRAVQADREEEEPGDAEDTPPSQPAESAEQGPAVATSEPEEPRPPDGNAQGTPPPEENQGRPVSTSDTAKDIVAEEI